MRNTFFKKTLVYITTLLLIIAVFTSLSLNVVAEEPGGEPPGYGEWYINGNGTYFALTNSSYLNITLTTTENVSVFLESTPRVVDISIESNCGATSTVITLTGFEVNKAYYLYQDFNLPWQFTTDETGSYCFTQDLLTPHHIVILENTSTIYIRPDGSIDPATAPIIQEGNTYKLTSDIYGTEYIIWIQKSNIVLDGQGYAIRYMGRWLYGVYVWDVENIIIKNLNFIGNTRGIDAGRVPHLTVTDCTFSNGGTGVEMEASWGQSNYLTITDNTFSNCMHGIWLKSGCHYATIAGNTISGNGYGWGIHAIHSWGSTITDNIISNNHGGLYFYGGSNTFITKNTISYNGRGIGFDTSYHTNKILYHNNIIGNTRQVEGVLAFEHTWDNGAGEGNYWSDYTGVDDGSNGREAGDGVGDTLIPHPYIDQGVGYYQLDNYPLMLPWSPNDPPVANAGGPYEVDEGEPVPFDASGSTDPDDDPLEYRWDFTNDGSWDTSRSSDPTATFTWYDDHTGTAAVEVYDGEYTDIAISTVLVSNVAPVADAGADHLGDEPSTFTFTGSHSDQGTLDTHTYEWDFNYDGVTFDIDATGNDVPNTWEDDFDGTVALRVIDDDGDWNIDTCHVTVTNVAPVITEFTGPLDPVQLGTPIEVTGSFDDPGTQDSHTATIDWGDTIVEGPIAVTSPFTQPHTYTEAGVFTVMVTIVDDDGGSDTATFHYIVIYDPDDGFVTGGGWIASPEGAYTPDPSLTGKANFGFVSKYKKGQQTPTGNTEFQFKAGDLNFHSNDYDWLVVAGKKAMYKGTGTINNIGNYGFILSAIDGDLQGGDGNDKFRIKIWDKDNNDIIIYDNNIGNDEDVDPTTIIGGGNIKIHNN